MTMDTAPMMNANAMANMRLDDSPHMTVRHNSIGFDKPESLKHLMLDVNAGNLHNNRPRSTTSIQPQPLEDKHRVRHSIASSSASTSSKHNSSSHRRSSAPSVTPSNSNSTRSSRTTSSRGSRTSKQLRDPAPSATYKLRSKYSQDNKENRADRDETIYLDELSHLLLEELPKENPKIVIRALENLAVYCSRSIDLSSQACHMGAPASVVNIMKKWTTQKNIQAKCFRALIAMTVGDDATHVRKTLWMVGGMEQVLDTMARFPDSRSVQFFGCNAILSLLPSGSHDGPEDNDTKIKKWMGRRFVRECKGVKTVISAMIQFEEDRQLQEAGCSVLLKLATFMHHGTDRKMLLESGAVSAFSVALESHSNDELIQHYTTLFMNFMSGDV